MEFSFFERHASVLIVLLVVVLFPLGVCLALALIRFKDRLSLLSTAVFAAFSLALLVMSTTLWHPVSGHLRWLVAAGLLFSLLRAARRLRTLPWWSGRSWLRLAGFTTNLLLMAFAVAQVVMLVYLFRTASTYEGTAIELTSPLRVERAVVLQGGSSVYFNHHVALASQRHALDIVAIDPTWQRRARALFPGLTDYVIYGSEVLAPCDGTVANLENGRREYVPPERDPHNAFGNHVLLHCQGRSVMLAHLRPHSIPVRVGERVRRGQVLGSVGNSGNTSEPHLHIQVVEGLVADHEQTYDAESVPMRFAGQFLIRGDVMPGAGAGS